MPTRHRLAGTVGVIGFLVLGQPKVATAQTGIPSCDVAAPGQVCSKNVFQAVGQDLASASVSLGEAIGASLAELKANLQKARARVFASGLKGAELQRAQSELSGLLTAKDYYLCLVDVILAPRGAGMQGPAGGFYNSLQAQNYRTFADFDGNVPGFSRGLFNRWTSVVEEKGRGTAGRTLSQFIDGNLDAIGGATPEYERYVIARDWAEYAAAGRNLTDDPKQYAITLIAIEGPWMVNSWGRAEVLQASSAYYSAMVALIGQQAMDKAVRTVMIAKKDRDGLLAPALRAGGGQYTDPWEALVAAAGETSLRDYAVTQFTFHARSTGSYSQDMHNAAAKYDQLVAARGEEAVLRDIKKVHDAPKEEDGKLSDPRLVGTSKSTTVLAIEDLLGAPKAPAVSNADMVDNPDFLQWQHFKTGATAVYGMDLGHTKEAQTARLRSIDATGATVAESAWEVEAGHAPDVRTSIETLEARIAPNQTSASQSEDAPAVHTSKTATPVAHRPVPNPISATPTDSGTETLKVNGKVFECKWRRRGQLVVWSNSAVPGGVVLYYDHNYRVLQPQITDPAAIHSPNDLQFNVESVSGGPYRQEITEDQAATTTPSRAATSRPASPPALSPASPVSPTPPGPPVSGGATPPIHAGSIVIPVNTAVTVTTISVIDLRGVDAGRRFVARLEQPITDGATVLIPVGTEVVLKVRRQDQGVAITADTAIIAANRVKLLTSEVYQKLADVSSAPGNPGRVSIRIGGTPVQVPTGTGVFTQIPYRTELVFKELPAPAQ